jgi:hypothetical protein
MGIKNEQERKQYHHDRRVRSRANDLCQCGRPRAEGFTRCRPCVDRDRENSKLKRARRRQNGLCQQCGKKAIHGRSKCEGCKERSSGYTHRLKTKVISAYGGQCICCGEKELSFLTIDHINGGGRQHRITIKTHRLYNWLINNNLPKDGYQCLCFNCNMGRQVNGGICPHQSMR